MSSLLSRIGIGAAKVDTVLKQETVIPGQNVEASIHVEGGSTAQDVDAINLVLATMYKTDEGTGMGLLSQQRANKSFTIEPGETRSFDVEIVVPYETPLTVGHTRVWLRTGLDIDWSLDPGDDDQLQVKPDKRVTALFGAIEQLGFGIHDAECKQVLSGFKTSFAQELAFKPRGGNYAGRVNELEVVVRPEADHVEALLEVDARLGGLGGMLGGEIEQKRRIRFTGTDVDAIREQIKAQLPS